MSNRNALWAGALVVLLILTAGAGATLALWTRPSAPAPTATASTLAATVTVAAGTELGPLNNPARYQNASGPSQLLGPQDERRIAQLEPTVVRAWFKPQSYYDHTSRSYNFDYPAPGGNNNFYEYGQQVSTLSKQLFANFDQCDQELMTLADPQQCREVLKTGIRHYKLRYPNLRYIELFNEPDKIWSPNEYERPAIDVVSYYVWYKIGYAVVNEINDELRPAVKLLFGGPAAYTFNPAFLGRFLDLYRADPDPVKRLDFISYHQYKHRDDPAKVQTEKETMRQWLSARGLKADTPTFVTEYGVFPGLTSGTTFEDDLLTQAAAMSTLGYYYLLGGTDMAMHWVFNHGENDRKSMLVDGADGKVYPYYNLVAMQHMLKSRQLEADSDSLSAEGIGVNAIASRDRTGVAVLVTNYQWTQGAAEYETTVKFNDLAPEYSKRNILVDRYLVDAATSNYALDPERSELQRVEHHLAPAGSALSTTFHLSRNAISLLVLTPLRAPK